HLFLRSHFDFGESRTSLAIGFATLRNPAPEDFVLFRILCETLSALMRYLGGSFEEKQTLIRLEHVDAASEAVPSERHQIEVCILSPQGNLESALAVFISVASA